jgi:hypothetical protein
MLRKYRKSACAMLLPLELPESNVPCGVMFPAGLLEGHSTIIFDTRSCTLAKEKALLLSQKWGEVPSSKYCQSLWIVNGKLSWENSGTSVF